MSAPKGYSRGQIALHWIVAAIVIPQFFLHDDMAAAWRAFRHGTEMSMTALVYFHIYAGIAILGLMLWRLSLRIRLGAPAAPEGEHPLLKVLAAITHWTLYLILIALPVTGLVAWFGGVTSAGEVHQFFKLPLLILVALHIAAALFHQFVLKTGLIDRMKTPA